jgi:hypothetical protein
MWARLFLADLFVHGIGGAKYDEISDFMIADYYGIVPPQMACVSATLLLELPHSDATCDSIRQLRRELRDLTWNPQRYEADDADMGSLVARRRASVERGEKLRRDDRRNRPARREAFNETRSVNALMAPAHVAALSEKRRQLDGDLDKLRQDEIANGREYFFALHSHETLEKLVDALPKCDRFRV